MNDYQKEQLCALQLVRQGMTRMGRDQQRALIDKTHAYLQFRQTVDRLLDRSFSRVCTKTCYDSRTSACCSKDGIITFFSDMVINALHSTPEQLDHLQTVLNRENRGHRCVYLGDKGCLLSIRPLVCAMFLCDRAMDTVFSKEPGVKQEWERLRRQEKTFRWPDRPVLFDELEKMFLRLGYQSSLMHLNFSPGLLNVKRKAGL